MKDAGPLLPVGIYVVDSRGQFLYCNEICKHILGIKKRDDVTKLNMVDFYAHPEQRPQLIKKMEDAGGKLSQEIIEFKKLNSKNTIFIEDNCMRYDDFKHVKEYYITGSILDVTQLNRYRQLFDELTAGVFRVDKNNKFIMINQAVARILGYDSCDELKGTDEGKLWKNQSKFKDYIKELNEKGSVHNYLAEMTKKDGHTVYIQKNSKLWLNDENEVIGREGTFTDMTTEHNYTEAINKLSFGYFEIEFIGDKQIIKHCNQKFADIFGFTSVQSIIGTEITDNLFLGDNKERILDAIEAAEADGSNCVQDFEIVTQSKTRQTFHVLIDMIIRPAPHGRTIVGIVHDISKLKSLEQTLNNKRFELGTALNDLDKFVHQYISPIMNIDSTAQSMLEILEKRLDQSLDHTQRIEISRKRTDDLITVFEDFLGSIGKDEHEHRLIKRLEMMTHRLQIRNSLYSSDPILRELYTRELILESSDIIKLLLKEFESRRNTEAYINLERALEKIKDMLDVYILQLQQRLLNNTRITYKVIETLRRYLFTGSERKCDFTKMNLIKIIKNNIELYYDMARKKGLIIIPPRQSYVLMDISETYIDRMISNLILNAVKYSYERTDGFIRINIDDRRTDVEIRIENYGVPIMADELEKVFEFGYRGVKSYDWNRTGSGIGLADARHTVEIHGGDISIESKPASNYKSGEEYNVPYLTTVTVTLPKRRLEK